MTTEPTAKHQEEAWEMLRGCERQTGVYLGSGSELNAFVQRIASALSSRDQEIREVLEGLRTGDKCWCEPQRTGPHSCACLATRVLWEKVKG